MNRPSHGLPGTRRVGRGNPLADMRVRDDALAAGLIDAQRWDRGLADLRRTAEEGGTFLYTFFSARAVVPG